MKFNIFIDAEDEEDLNDKIMEMSCEFMDDRGLNYDDELIDIDTKELDEEFQKELDEVDLNKAMKRCMD